MSTNTRNAHFRKADVDEYDEDNYRDEETAEGDSSAASQLADREAKVKELRVQGKHAQALTIILENPPSGSKDKALKDKNLALVLDVLTRFKGSELESAVGGLDSDQRDTLMKYIYKGFAEGGESSYSILLQFHEKVYKASGLGCIMRVMTDRKTV